MPLPGYGKSPAGIKTNTPAGKAREEKVGQNGQRLITIDDMFMEINSRLHNIEQMLKGNVSLEKMYQSELPKASIKHTDLNETSASIQNPPWVEVPTAADTILAAKDYLTKNGKEKLQLQLNTFFVNKVSELKDEDRAVFLENLRNG